MARKQVLNSTEAAEFLNINPYTLRRYIREGKIKAHKLSKDKLKGKWRIWKSDLIKFLNEDNNNG